MLLKDEILKTYGVEVDVQHLRLQTNEWTEQESCTVICPNCCNCYIIYRKPFSAYGKIYRYWAVVCLVCKQCKVPEELQPQILKSLRKWQQRLSSVVGNRLDSYHLGTIVGLIHGLDYQVQICEFGNGSCLICTDSNGSSWDTTITESLSLCTSVTCRLIFCTNFDPLESCNAFNDINRSAKSYCIRYEDSSTDQFFVGIEMDCDFENASRQFLLTLIHRWINIVERATSFFENSVDIGTNAEYDYDPEELDPDEEDSYEISEFRSEVTWGEIWSAHSDNYGFTNNNDDEDLADEFGQNLRYDDDSELMY